MNPEEIRALASECGASIGKYYEYNVIAFKDEELAEYTAAVEAKERERCAQEIEAESQDNTRYEFASATRSLK